MFVNQKRKDRKNEKVCFNLSIGMEQKGKKTWKLGKNINLSIGMECEKRMAFGTNFASAMRFRDVIFSDSISASNQRYFLRDSGRSASLMEEVMSTSTFHFSAHFSNTSTNSPNASTLFPQIFNAESMKRWVISLLEA